MAKGNRKKRAYQLQDDAPINWNVQEEEVNPFEVPANTNLGRSIAAGRVNVDHLQEGYTPKDRVDAERRRASLEQAVLDTQYVSAADFVPQEITPEMQAEIDQAEYEAREKRANEGSFTDWWADKADDLMPDDLGSWARGEDGPIGNIPIIGDTYQYTGGLLTGAVMSGGESALNFLNNFNENIYKPATTWAWTALPGGPRTIDVTGFNWNADNSSWWMKDEDHRLGFQGDVNKIADGRAMIAGIAGMTNWAGDFAPQVLSVMKPILGPTAGMMDYVAAADGGTSVYVWNPDAGTYDILEAQEAGEFDSDISNLQSGVAGAVSAVGGDPTVALGGVTAAAKAGVLGARVASATGAGFKTLKSSEKMFRAMEAALDAEARGETAATGFFSKLLGAQGEGPLTHLKNLVDGNAHDAGMNPWIRGATDKDTAESVFAAVGQGNYRGAVAAAKAMRGIRQGWDELRETAPEAFDILISRQTGVDFFTRGGRGTAGLDAAQVALGRRIVGDAQRILDEVGEVVDTPFGRRTVGRVSATADDVGVVDTPFGRVALKVDEAPYVNILTKGGLDVAAVAKVSGAWRAGRATAQFSKGMEKVAPTVDNLVQFDSTGGKWLQRTVQKTAASRAVIVLAWAGQGRPTGIVHLKGGDGANAPVEVRNWLAHSHIGLEQRQMFFDKFIAANNPTAKRAVLQEMEQAEVMQVARKAGITPAAAEAAYHSYRTARARHLSEVKSTTKEATGKVADQAFTRDENGNLVKVAGLYSELDEAFPLLNSKEFGRVIGHNKEWMREGFAGGQIALEHLDFLNNMWKVSVLLRLGYTMRNVTEGAIRSVATIGLMAMNPVLLARGGANALYGARMSVTKYRAKAIARAVDDLYTEMNDQLKMVDELKATFHTDEVAELEAKIAQKKELLNAASSALFERSYVKPAEVLPPVKLAKPADVSATRSVVAEQSKVKKAEDALIEVRTRHAAEQPEFDALAKELDGLKKIVDVADAKSAVGRSAEYQAASRRINAIETKMSARDARLAKAEKRVEDAKVALANETKAAKAKNLETRKAQRDRKQKAVDEANRKEAERYARDLKKAEDEYADAVKHEAALRKEVEQAEESLRRMVDGDLQTATGSKMKAYQDELERLRKEVVERQEQLNKLVNKVNKRYSKGIGRSGNVVGKGRDGEDIVYAGAFEGAEGDIARMLSGSEGTNSQIFQTGYDAQRARMARAKEWKEIDPRTIVDRDGWNEYFDQLTITLNQSLRNDEVIKVWLRHSDEATDEQLFEAALRYLHSADGRGYANSVRTADNTPLVNANGKLNREAAHRWVAEQLYRFNTEIPKSATGLRQTLRKRQVSSMEMRRYFSDQESLPTITAPVENRLAVGGKLSRGEEFFSRNVTGTLMKMLGTIPENALLRHPFYNAVYRSKQLRYAREAAEQGLDLNSASVRAGINQSAHKASLKSTRETMYTIERQSNASNVLRFVSPFFPAWENAIKTWGRIAIEQPAVIGMANAAWNIPNGLGWVVDEDGNKVSRSNYLSPTEKTYIVMPRNVAKALDDMNKDLFVGKLFDPIPILNSLAVPVDEDGNPIAKTRQSGMNVVFPGGIFDPGIGVAVTIPTSMFLAGKPDVVEVLRKSMGEEAFNRIAPVGSLGKSPLELLKPTLVKRVEQKLFGGEDESTAYFNLRSQMIQDEIVKRSIAGLPPMSTKDIEKVVKNADRFWEWSIVQAGSGFTGSTSYNSPFTKEKAFLYDLMARPDLNYTQKQNIFRKKFGDDMMGLMASRNDNKFGINATLQSWQTLQEEEGRLDDIADEFGHKFVGQFVNFGSNDPFSGAVYSELRGLEIDGEKAIERLTPEEQVAKQNIADGWKRYFKDVAEMDDIARSKGYSGWKELPEYKEIKAELVAEISADFKDWGSEYNGGYDGEKFPNQIRVSRILVTAAPESPTRDALEDYLELRERTHLDIKEIDAMENLSTPEKNRFKEEARAEANAIAMQIRSRDMAFADYYDRYLDDDEYQEVK